MNEWLSPFYTPMYLCVPVNAIPTAHLPDSSYRLCTGHLFFSLCYRISMDDTIKYKPQFNIIIEIWASSFKPWSWKQRFHLQTFVLSIALRLQIHKIFPGKSAISTTPNHIFAVFAAAFFSPMVFVSPNIHSPYLLMWDNSVASLHHLNRLQKKIVALIPCWRAVKTTLMEELIFVVLFTEHNGVRRILSWFS